jgi:hypothetical protein
MDGCGCPTQCVFSVRTAGFHHFVEGDDAVSWLELRDIGPDGVNDAGDVVALIDGFGGVLCCLGSFPAIWSTWFALK